MKEIVRISSGERKIYHTRVGMDTRKPKNKRSEKQTMPIRLGKKKYKSFDRAAAAVAKKKGISKERAKAYVAVVDRKQHKKKK